MKPLLRKKTIVTLLFGLFAVILSGVYYLGFYNETLTGTNILTATLKDARSNNEYIIELRDDGFYPEYLEINKGDTVVFITTRSKSFWPASSLHPSHTIYSEFDPREPIDPKDTWSFRFDRAGEWKYHDHLAPIYKGKIVVSGELQDGGDYTQGCENLEDDENREQCWEHLINRALGEEGVEAAFGIIEDLYETNLDCHPYAHIIGEEAYNIFSQNKGMVLTPKTYYCGYGFYHGFMETLLHTTGDLEEAREFCSYVDAQLSQQVLGTWAACYHGIGHGAVDGGDPRYWGDEEAMIGPAIELCEQVAQTDFQEYICATGVFNATEILSQDLKYKLFKIREDPFWLCRRQPERYKEACYTNMIPALLNLTDDDVRESASIIEDIYETGGSYDIRYRGILAVSVEYMRLNPGEFGNAVGGVKVCRGLSERSRLPCIEGLSEGHIKYGKPEVEYIKAIEFCKSRMLLEDERQICFKKLLSGLRLWYSYEKAHEICESVEDRYRVFCSR